MTHSRSGEVVLSISELDYSTRSKRIRRPGERVMTQPEPAAYDVVIPGVGTIGDSNDIPLRQHQNHRRDWRRNLYVYPVISRRSRGLSLGINLNPDMACNFDCVYCQVDRTVSPRTRQVDPERLGHELAEIITCVQNGELFDDPSFADVPTKLRKINDIAFSGDGEPTACTRFGECVERIATTKRDTGLAETRIVLITNACYLTRPEVVAGLAVLDENNGEIWAKLDAGTEEYYRKVNRGNFRLQHVVDNIAHAARVRPLVIQSLFMRIEDQPPSDAELLAYLDRLGEITSAGGRIAYVQIYTVARRPVEDFVTPLSNEEVDAIAKLVQDRTALRAAPFYGIQ